MKLINKIINPIIRIVLESPLHPLISESFMLISVKGNKSGMFHTFPVNYLLMENKITVFSRKTRYWWKNLKYDAPVKMLIKGKWFVGKGEVIRAEKKEIATELYEFYRKIAPKKISREEALKKAPIMVLIRIRLD